ncbi:FG-GAP-like repeat-containing protein [Ulvibacterium marinum]|uniref:FG-GAP-like repeat-containing protein n=1 Tax=Ulvibacterium marinum TaxID=2419782 RepID=UPI0024948F72|nr:FG-GAP-like repeat-containing protein [Ulvibacterium marinum]
MKAKNLRTKDRVFTILLLLGLSFTAISQTDPTVVATAPAVNALNADNTADIGLTFSEIMDAATLNTAHVKISGNYGQPLGFGTPSVNATTAVFDPDRDFFPGEVITATLTTDVASSAGNSLASPFTYRFTAGVSPDSPGEFPNGQNIIYDFVRGANRNDVTVADLDGDGDLDVIANRELGNSGAWFPNDGSGNLGEARIIQSGLNSFRRIIPADLDGDGDLEVLAVTTADSQIDWYLNDGSENFTDGMPISFNTVNVVKDLAIGDLDGDGDLDMLLASFNKITWYPNDGLTFDVSRIPAIFGTERTITTATAGASGVATGDLDGDGDLDVVSSSAEDNKIAWYPNDGSGNFGAQRTITQAEAGAEDVIVADLDGDGDLDVISTSADDNRIAWYPNDGSGNFGTQQTITTAVDGIRDVTVADLDGDGNLDVLSASFNDNRVAWYPNDGNGNFGDQQTITTAGAGVGYLAVATGDLDGDGDLDVFSARSDATIAWYENAGSSLRVTATDPAANALGIDNAATLGLTFNQTIDAATLTTDNMKITGNYGRPLGFGAPSVNATTAVFDPDRNFFPGEQITATLTTEVAGSAGTSLASPFTYSFTAGVNPDSPGEFPNGQNIIFEYFGGSNRNDVTVADLDGDGDLDVISEYEIINGVAWFPNDGSGNLGAPLILDSGGYSFRRIIPADLDGDGDLEVLAVTTADGQIDWYLNDGSENFTDGMPISLNTVNAVKDLAIGDLDGDGDLDVLLASLNKITWYPNDGLTFDVSRIPAIFGTERTITTATAGASGVATGDLDGDGDLDVVSSSAEDNKIAWYPNDGSGNFGAQRTITQAEAGAEDVIVADLDGDGNLDVISTSADDNRIAWYRNDGNGNFGNQQTITTAVDGIRDVTVADLDGDGNLDVLSATFNDNRVAWYPNDGNGNFGDQQTIATEAGLGNGYTAIATGDLDGDGDLDVFSARATGASIAWYENAGSTTLTANCADPFTIQLDANGTASITVDDIDDGSIGATGMEIDVTDFDCSHLGENTVTLTVTNALGTTDTCTTTVTVEDSIAPIADRASLSDITGGCGTTIIEVPMATDNCGGTISATTNDLLTYNEQGTFTVTWTYDDGNGNTSTQTQNVIVEDSIAPVADMATLPDITGGCGATVTEVPTATDNCAGTITATTDDPLAYPEQGTYTVTWTYDDGNGNTSTQEQTVIAENSIASATPDMDTLPDVTGECGITITEVPTATADCGGTVVATTDDPLEYDRPGTFTITWTYNVGNGNTSTQEQTVIVEDSVAPVADMATLPDVIGGCGATVTILPTATDNCAGTVTATTDDPLTYPEQGTYTVTWTYDDGNGNTSMQTQTVIAESSIAPPIPDMVALTEVRGECSATVIAVPTATDNCAGTIIGTTDDPLEYDRPGTFTITWAYSTGNGNTSTQTQTVIVEDTIPPIAVAHDITVELDENGQATITTEDIDNGSTDNCGIADLSLDTAIFDCPELGDTNVELTVTDVSGNSSSASATVTFIAPDNDSDGVADVCGPEMSIIPGQGVSPNADGIHDTWVIENITDHPDALIKVFDRNGREVFSTNDYQNDWGGTEGNGSSLLPVGSYYYVVHLQQPIARNITGWLYLNY